MKVRNAVTPVLPVNIEREIDTLPAPPATRLNLPVETPIAPAALSPQMATTGNIDGNFLLRAAAFERVRNLNETRDQLTASDLKLGFVFDGQRIPLVFSQRRLCKPAQMGALLSIKTLFPKPDAKVWYDDPCDMHRHIYDADETADCAFSASEVGPEDGRWLRDAIESGVPIIYVLGISPRRYQAIFPAFVMDWDATALNLKIAFGSSENSAPTLGGNPAQRRSALQAVKQRLSRASFREAVITAYKGRCALSGLPEPLLLAAAHILQGENNLTGRPLVSNGLPLSKIHLAAFDSNLIGIDPDFRIHVSDQLLKTREGLILEDLKRLNNAQLHLPDRPADRPDRDRLAVRFESFLAAA